MLGKTPHRLKIVVRCFHKKNLHVKLLTKSGIIKKKETIMVRRAKSLSF